MLKMIYLNKMQQEIMDSNERVTLVTPEMGAGTTYGLLLKALDYATNNQEVDVTFFASTTYQLTASGGLVQKLHEILLGSDGYRWSKQSLILTLANGSKIKFMGCRETSMDNIRGLSSDLVIFHNNCPFDFIMRFYRQGARMVVADLVLRCTEEDSWLYQTGLLDKEGNLDPSIKHITGCMLDNINLVKSNPKYIECIQSLPEVERTRLTRKSFKIEE